MEHAALREGAPSERFADVPTRTIAAAGARLVYRELGDRGAEGVPLVGLTHLGANLDSWDPEVVDPLSAHRRMILIGYRGVGASTGAARDRFEDMAADAIAAIRALGLTRVDLLGLSMGGMVVQEILRLAPDLAERVVLAGTGPQGGPGLTRMTGVFVRGVAHALATSSTPTSVLFFPRSGSGRQAAKEYRSRLTRRSAGRDAPVSPAALRAQLRAVNRWGRERTSAAQTISGPVLILHGDRDRMVPRRNTDSLLTRSPHAQVHIFPDSGHGVVSQNRQAITGLVDRFLSR